jgi:hypothetical protein
MNFHPHLHFLVTEGGDGLPGVHLLCPQCGGTMKIISFLTDYAVVGKIIDHLKLTFVADRPPPPHAAYQEVLMVAEAGSGYVY